MSQYDVLYKEFRNGDGGGCWDSFCFHPLCEVVNCHYDVTVTLQGAGKGNEENMSMRSKGAVASMDSMKPTGLSFGALRD